MIKRRWGDAGSIYETSAIGGCERYDEKAIAFHRHWKKLRLAFRLPVRTQCVRRSVKLPMANGNEGSKTALDAVQAATVRSPAADTLKGGAGPGDLGNLIVSCKLQGREV